MKHGASMRQRVFLVLLGGVAASVILTAVLADREGRHHFAEVREAQSVERIRQLVLALEAIPADTRPRLLEMTGHGMRARVGTMGTPERSMLDPELTSAWAQSLGADHNVVVARGTPGQCASLSEHHEGDDSDRPSCRVVSLTLRDGTPMDFVLRSTSDSPWNVERARVWLYLLFLPLCLAGLAYTVARMATAPLGRLERAAAALGHDIERPPMPEKGPSEVRSAATAFNKMQMRIRKHVQERTQILAAITHDLQTPLTRLRLRLEKVADESLRAKLIDDLDAMQAMIREGLEFARSTDVSQPVQRVDLDSLLETICADAVDAGQDVTLTGRAAVSVTCTAAPLQRALTNLIDNAVKYGKFARVSVQHEPREVAIHIVDGGLGIPDAKLEAVFEPFHRLEVSRSRETGGTGLGLTIARRVARRCGGDVVLRNLPGGGLEAVLTLPANT
jgi:signal transduction histidine kinase